MGKTSTNISVLNDTKAKLNEIIMLQINLNKTTKKSYDSAISMMCDHFLEELKKELQQRNEEANHE